jgi:hypothetical protein
LAFIKTLQFLKIANNNILTEAAFMFRFHKIPGVKAKGAGTLAPMLDHCSR